METLKFVPKEILKEAARRHILTMERDFDKLIDQLEQYQSVNLEEIGIGYRSSHYDVYMLCCFADMVPPMFKLGESYRLEDAMTSEEKRKLVEFFRVKRGEIIDKIIPLITEEEMDKARFEF